MSALTAKANDNIKSNIDRAKEAGFHIFWSMGGAYYAKGSSVPRDSREWSKGFDCLEDAAIAALLTTITFG